MSILTPQTDIIIELREILLWIEALKTKMKFWVKQTRCNYQVGKVGFIWIKYSINEPETSLTDYNKINETICTAFLSRISSSTLMTLWAILLNAHCYRHTPLKCVLSWLFENQSIEKQKPLTQMQSFSSKK